MASILKVDTIQDTSGNNIINESSNTITIGASGDTVNLASGATAGFGKILQVLSTTKTDTYSESISTRAVGNNVTGLAVTITPTSASSKLLVYSAINQSRSGDSALGGFSFYRDGSPILVGDSAGSRLSVSVGQHVVSGATLIGNSFQFGQVDASSTNATTFNIRLNNSSSGITRTYYINRTEDDTDANNQNRAVSSIMVMEVSA